MYLPTMPEDNLLEAMTTIRDAKFYGKLYITINYVVTKSMVIRLVNMLHMYVTHESSLLLVYSLSQRPSLYNWRRKYYIYHCRIKSTVCLYMIIHVDAYGST